MLYDMSSGLFKRYRLQRYQQIQAKLGQTEAVARKLYDTKQHNRDSTGNTDEIQPSFYVLKKN